MFPFTQFSAGANKKIRIFKSDVNSDELIWHRDRRDRVIHVLQSSGWFFQRDDQLPISLKAGDTLSIPKATWHRIIKKNNCSDLVVEIIENDQTLP